MPESTRRGGSRQPPKVVLASVLSRKLALHDVEDVEAFCIGIFKAKAGEIPDRDHEDAIAYLIETAWELSVEYRTGGMAFSAYATYTLKRRLVDWQRRQYGRTRWSSPSYVYERPRPHFLPLEHRPDGPVHGLLDHAYGGGIQDVLGLQRARGGKRARPNPKGSRSQSRSAA